TEVKPSYADGTAPLRRGRAGYRQAFFCLKAMPVKARSKRQLKRLRLCGCGLIDAYVSTIFPEEPKKV
ncbi:MAG: hypothetical protein FWH41_04760, partial [Treponema sp.]|nr:hypothetical protein [Treponema sp.]